MTDEQREHIQAAIDELNEIEPEKRPMVTLPRTLTISDCYLCRFRKMGDYVCRLTGQTYPPTGIPDWCPLPVAQERKP